MQSRDIGAGGSMKGKSSNHYQNKGPIIAQSVAILFGIGYLNLLVAQLDGNLFHILPASFEFFGQSLLILTNYVS
jgi:hypothetical protein